MDKLFYDHSIFLFKLFGLEYNSYIFRLSIFILIELNLLIGFLYLIFKLIKMSHNKNLSNKKYKRLFRSLQELFRINLKRKAITYTKQSEQIESNKNDLSRGITNSNCKMIQPLPMEIIKKSNLKGSEFNSNKSVSFNV